MPTQTKPAPAFLIEDAATFPPFDSDAAWKRLPPDIQDFIESEIGNLSPIPEPNLEGLHSFSVMAGLFGLKKETAARYLTLFPKMNRDALQVRAHLSLRSAEAIGFTTASARNKRMLRQEAGLFRVKPTMVAIAAAIAAHNYEVTRRCGTIYSRESTGYRI